MLDFRPVSSLEKCFPDSKPDQFEEFRSISVLKEQRVSFQLLYKDTAPESYFGTYYITLAADGVAPSAVTVRSVEYIPSTMPAFLTMRDAGYLRTDIGLYPDLLLPLPSLGAPVTPTAMTHAIWVDIDTSALAVGTQDIRFRILHENGEELGAFTVTVTVIDAVLPPQALIYTNWLHTDCLATRYEVEVFSEEYWRITENYVRNAAENGMNALLTPVLTPPLDTRVGGERPTVQLVEITYLGGVYSFDFSRLDRFVEMATRCGIRYFEIAHLFTQWGAEHAPKVMATTERGYERIFGWETNAAGSEYGTFLAAFLPALRARLAELGIADRCIFHISDEPSEQHSASYAAARAAALPYLEGGVVMDALSNVQYYKDGLVPHPIPSSNHIKPFLEEKIEGLWTYYCCGQGVDVSNRFFAMPGARTRYIGVQLWYYRIAGFLHWAYNFWYSSQSIAEVDPFRDSCGTGFSPSGDCFVVYPGKDGKPLESIRLHQFREGLEDIRALSLAESLVGREAVLAAITPITGEITFDRCLLSSSEMLAVREAVNRLIASAVS